MDSGQTDHVGLYDGFEAYRTVTDDEYRRLLQRALVVVDTNVLLNLYRYSAETRTSVVAVLAALGDRLYIPHQVIEEFWRNRERALGSPLAEVEESARNIQRLRDQIIEVLRGWVNKANLANESVNSISAKLNIVVEEAVELIDSMADEDLVKRARSTHQDPILEMLAPVLEGRVGPPMDKETRSVAVKEGQRRASAGEPPGFADAKKADLGPDGAAGDYIVWAETLKEASNLGLDVVFVTGDVKRDWWRYEGSFARGARIELVRELRDKAGTSLFMIRPDRLLALADAVSVKVDESSVTNIERAALQVAKTVREEVDLDPTTSWDANSIALFMRRLAVGWPVQEAVIRFAATEGGYVSRDDVYALGEYEPERQLRGFTRPVNRLAQQMRDSGEVADNAEDVLAPIYEEGRYGSGWVDGYRLTPAVTELVLAL